MLTDHDLDMMEADLDPRKTYVDGPEWTVQSAKALLAEVRRLRRCWQPIATAPKDGSVLLAACQLPPGRGREWFVGQASWTLRAGGCWQMPDDPAIWDGVQPTHWQPLPEPPP